MPFDGHTPAELRPAIKHPLLSVEGLVAWLETRNPHEAYNYIDGTACLLAQYLRSRGRRGVCLGPTSGSVWLFWPIRIPAQMNDIAAACPHTFGAALHRARVVIAGKEP